MFYTRGLLLKGILGFGAASAATFGGLTQKEKIAGWFSSGEETTKPAEAITETKSKLLDEVGLSCDLANATADNGVACSKKTGEGAKNIKVKREGSTEFEVSSIPSGGGKIKVYKVEDKGENGYAGGLKLVIEEGNINGGDDNNKLEEFETYEIKEETNSSNPETKTYYLNRKTKASDKIKVLLGLDTCTFPGDACSLTTEQIKKIKFEGKDGEVTGTGTLQISIASASETQDFPYGFKFTLTPSSGGNINIPRGTGKEALTLTSTNPTVFKIKKKEDKTLTLEEALTQDTLTKKVGLSCPTATDAGVDCSKATGEDAKVKVKQESNTFDLTTALPTDGKKIKLYKAESTEGYNKNLKFVIEGGDIGSNGSKLEEFETYEIKQDGTEWKLTRKKKSKEEKRRILGLPDTCTFPESGSTSPTPCTVESNKINNIKFDGKTSATLSGGSATLNVEVASSTDADFPHGFKFTLTPSAGSTLTINRSGSPGNITLGGDKSKEFKIKKDGKNLTLEEAWTLEKLAGKVSLSCTASGSAPSETEGVNCTKAGNTNIKVKKAENTNFEVSTISEGKIKAYKTSSSETYNEGFKFVIEENDINGTDTNKLEQFETYEIKKETNEWKLVRKSEAKVGIKKALGLPEEATCELPTDSSAGEKTCDLDESKFKKINFEGKNDSEMTGGASAKLKISKVSGTENGDFGPFGYKFKLESANEAKISNSVTIAGNTNTEFKIKRQTNSNNITLEKAWTAKILGAKVGLECSEDNAENKECTLQTSKVNLKVDGSKKFTGLSKKTDGNGDGGEKKVKFEVGVGNYNQGFKFTAESEICLQNGNNGGTDEDKKIEAKGSSEISYEIKKDGDEWYLTKVTKGGAGA